MSLENGDSKRLALIMTALKDPTSEDVRREAANILSNIAIREGFGVPAILNNLRTALKDTDPAVRGLAATGMADIANNTSGAETKKYVIKYISEALIFEKDEIAKRYMKESIDQLKRK